MPSGRKTRVLCDDISFGESPRWRQGRLWFSDFFVHAVKSISLAGDLRTEVEIDDQPSGLGWMPDGSLLIVSMIKRQVLRRSLKGKLGVHADLSHMARFHCNDMVVDRKGRAYIGDFGFDLPKEAAARGIRNVIADHPTSALICVEPDGTAREAAADMHFPNGTVIAPDGKTLIVAETLAEELTAFDIGADGSLTNRRIWARISPCVPDGIALNAEGNVWIADATSPHCLLVAPGGKTLETIGTSMPCFSCMLGGDDGRTLFMFAAIASKDSSGADIVKGELLITTVDVPHAGLP